MRWETLLYSWELCNDHAILGELLGDGDFAIHPLVAPISCGLVPLLAVDWTWLPHGFHMASSRFRGDFAFVQTSLGRLRALAGE